MTDADSDTEGAVIGGRVFPNGVPPFILCDAECLVDVPLSPSDDNMPATAPNQAWKNKWILFEFDIFDMRYVIVDVQAGQFPASQEDPNTGWAITPAMPVIDIPDLSGLSRNGTMVGSGSLNITGHGWSKGAFVFTACNLLVRRSMQSGDLQPSSSQSLSPDEYERGDGINQPTEFWRRTAQDPKGLIIDVNNGFDPRDSGKKLRKYDDTDLDVFSESVTGSRGRAYASKF